MRDVESANARRRLLYRTDPKYRSRRKQESRAKRGRQPWGVLPQAEFVARLMAHWEL